MKMLIISIICACITLLAGCFFARVDIEKDQYRISGTIVTVGKKITIDPNSYNSDPERFHIFTPWGYGEIGD